MDTRIVRLGQLAVASILLSVFCTIGCTTWQASLDHPIATKVGGSSVSRMSADLQRILLLQAVHILNADFNRISNSPEWKKHLQLETIQDLLNQPNNVPPDKATRERLLQIANRFDAIANKNDFRMIYELSSFRTVQAALPEFAIDPVVRHGRIIAKNLKLLSDELDGFSYGAGWKTFLKLDQLTEFTRSPQTLTRDDRNALIEILTQFEITKEVPEYIAIASVAGFDGALAYTVIFSLPFNYANVIALPLIFGLGADSGIHIVERMRRRPAQCEAFLRSGTIRGVFFSSLTTMLSFSNLAYTSHVGIASMGQLLTLGVFLTLIGSLVVLPAFLYRGHTVSQETPT